MRENQNKNINYFAQIEIIGSHTIAINYCENAKYEWRTETLGEMPRGKVTYQYTKEVEKPKLINKIIYNFDKSCKNVNIRIFNGNEEEIMSGEMPSLEAFNLDVETDELFTVFPYPLNFKKINIQSEEYFIYIYPEDWHFSSGKHNSNITYKGEFKKEIIEKITDDKLKNILLSAYELIDKIRKKVEKKNYAINPKDLDLCGYLNVGNREISLNLNNLEYNFKFINLFSDKKLVKITNKSGLNKTIPLKQLKDYPYNPDKEGKEIFNLFQSCWYYAVYYLGYGHYCFIFDIKERKYYRQNDVCTELFNYGDFTEEGIAEDEPQFFDILSFVYQMFKEINKELNIFKKE
jgi:hypothetical protein